ncbi:MAG TPA: hypothetical protein DCZ23_07780, partial [Lachnospiraceae bacterium]|nr:hypothetical protein [Lachnospiraceae bacterium]
MALMTTIIILIYSNLDAKILAKGCAAFMHIKNFFKYWSNFLTSGIGLIPIKKGAFSMQYIKPIPIGVE